jgi:lysine-N-methylase
MIFGGVGLCCEEAARLVLTADTPEYITLEAEGDYEECDGELLEIFLDLREEISKIFDQKEQTLVYIVERAEQAVKKAQSRADAESENPYEIREVSHKTIVEIVENSELLSDELPTLLKKSLCPNLETIKNNIVNNYLQNIFLYFLDRYLPKAVEDGDFLSKFEVAIFSLKAIELLFLGEENLTLDRAVYLTKLYSKEMEYNEDNIAAIEQI